MKKEQQPFGAAVPEYQDGRFENRAAATGSYQKKNYQTNPFSKIENGHKYRGFRCFPSQAFKKRTHLPLSSVASAKEDRPFWNFISRPMMIFSNVKRVAAPLCGACCR